MVPEHRHHDSDFVLKLPKSLGIGLGLLHVAAKRRSSFDRVGHGLQAVPKCERLGSAARGVLNGLLGDGLSLEGGRFPLGQLELCTDVVTLLPESLEFSTPRGDLFDLPFDVRMQVTTSEFGIVTVTYGTDIVSYLVSKQGESAR